MGFCEGYDQIDVCRHPRDYFYFYPEPPGEQNATNGRTGQAGAMIGCWTGMSDTDDQGVGGTPRGKECDLGCVSCPDLPAELESQYAQFEGLRWMHPHPQMLSIDATGVRRPLRATKVNLVPRFTTHYLTGSCFDNQGTECFGGTVCECHGDRSGSRNVLFTQDTGPTEERCIPSPRRLWWAKGYFPAQFLYAGMDFPPRTIGFGQSITNQGMFCRRFVIQNEDGSPKDEDIEVPIEGGEMLSPAFIRDSYRGITQGTQCVVNAMVFCQSAVMDSVCSNSYARSWEFSDPPGQRPTFYNERNTRHQFRLIEIGGNPHFRDLDNMFDGVDERDLAHLKAKNAAVRAALSQEFPTAGGDGTTSFRYLTHEFGGGAADHTNLNTWSHEWDANEEGVGIDALPVVGDYEVFGRWTGSSESTTPDHPVELVISRIEARLWLLPINGIDQREARDPFIEFHARFKLRIELAARNQIDSGFFRLDQHWFPEGNPEREVYITYDYGNRIEPPTVSRPDLTRLIYYDRETRTPVDLPYFVEWQGYLGQVGDVTSEDQRFFHNPSFLDLGVIDGIEGLEIGGWPTAHGTMSERPARKRDYAQIHGGSIRLVRFASN